MKQQEILGIDIGGSNIKTAIVGFPGGTILECLPLKLTPNTFGTDGITSAVAGIVDEADWNGKVGIGFPGVVKNGIARSAAHLNNKWIGLDLQLSFGQVTRDEVIIINDADAAGIAEMNYGAGQKHNAPDSGSVLLLTLGTGIGSALFHDGQLIPNTEFGHISLDGRDAELTAAASVRTREGLDWETWGNQLNRYLQEMEMLVSPDMIIIGGGISENFDKFEPYLRTDASIKAAAFGNNAGVIGAAIAAAAD